MKFTETNGYRVARTALCIASVCVFAPTALALVVGCNSPLETFASLPGRIAPTVGFLPKDSNSATSRGTKCVTKCNFNEA
jgi:hypothetical protein